MRTNGLSKRCRDEHKNMLDELATALKDVEKRGG